MALAKFFKSKYSRATILVSLVVAILSHLMEILSLFDVFEEEVLFEGITIVAVLNEVIFTAISLYMLFIINTLIFRLDKPFAKFTGKKIVLSLLLMMMASSGFANIFVLLHELLNISVINTTLHHYLHPVRDLMMASVVTGSCYVINLIDTKQLILTENQELKTQNAVNQYEALKSQLNPHMLFNSLNTLLALIREDNSKAERYTKDLSNVLRYTLQNDESSVMLNDELEFTKSYINLMKVRYEDNLKFNISIDPKYMVYYIPHISLQTLIENAIKHNEISAKKNLVINIRSGDDNYLYVENIIAPKRNFIKSSGIGLENLNKRCTLLYHKHIDITIKDGLFRVGIPLVLKK